MELFSTFFPFYFFDVFIIIYSFFCCYRADDNCLSSATTGLRVDGVIVNGAAEKIKENDGSLVSLSIHVFTIQRETFTI